MATFFLLLAVISLIVWSIYSIIKGKTKTGKYTTKVRPAARNVSWRLAVLFGIQAVVFWLLGLLGISWPWWVILAIVLMNIAFIARIVDKRVYAFPTKVRPWASRIPWFFLGATVLVLALAVFGSMFNWKLTLPTKTVEKNAESISLVDIQKLIDANNAKLIENIKELIPAEQPVQASAETVGKGTETIDSTNQPSQAQAGQFNLTCPTDAEMWKMVGLPENVKPVFHGEGIPWDHCQWQWQAYSTEMSITLPLPLYWQATVTHSDGRVVVYRGSNDFLVEDVAGFNLRYTASYDKNHWVNNDCALLSQEFAFGQRRNPSYVTESGNLTCNSFDGVSTDTCPATTAQVAALIGGNPNQWIAPDWELGAWVFHADEGQYVILEVPASLKGAADVVRLDYWNGQKNSADSFLPGDMGIGLNEASFHCHAAQ